MPRRALWPAPFVSGRTGAVLVLLFCLSACTTPVPLAPPVSVPAAPPPSEGPTYSEVGLASWYGAAHHGRLTANGETFDMQALTAAHRSLPFNTIVRVTNLSTGAMIKVRINDRGPFGRGRILDVSARAASVLGLAKDGVARVKLEVFASDQPSS